MKKGGSFEMRLPLLKERFRGVVGFINYGGTVTENESSIAIKTLYSVVSELKARELLFSVTVECHSLDDITAQSFDGQL